MQTNVRINGVVETFPINEGTRIYHLRRYIGERLGTTADNISLTALQSELPNDLRVCALPSSRIIDCLVREDLDINSPRHQIKLATPRLEPVRAPDPVLRLLVSAEGFDTKPVTVRPTDPVNVLRAKCAPLPDTSGRVAPLPELLLCDGRVIVDERQTFQDLLITSSCKMRFVNTEPSQHSQQSSIAGRTKTRRRRSTGGGSANSSSLLDGSFSRDDGTGSEPWLEELSLLSAKSSPSRRQGGPSRANIIILFEDPDDEGSTFDVTVASDRSVECLFSFVDHPESLELLCDGTLVQDLKASFWKVTEGDDHCLFSFRRKDFR